MISFLYFLLASCFLIGCFANIAGNAYGLDLVEKTAFGFMVFLFLRGFAVVRSFRKVPGSGASRLLAEHWLVAIGLGGTLLKFNSLGGAGPLMLVGYLSASLIFLFRAIRDLIDLLRSKDRSIRLESIFILLFCSSGLFTTMSKVMHWEGMLLSLLVSLILLGLLLLNWLIRLIRNNPPPPELQSRDKILSPVRSYFYILLVGNLHFAGTILGWVPGFQYLERPITFTRIREQNESDKNKRRLDCFSDNISIFFAKRQFSGVADVDSAAFCLPENEK
jgi:hypothetical protein